MTYSFFYRHGRPLSGMNCGGHPSKPVIASRPTSSNGAPSPPSQGRPLGRAFHTMDGRLGGRLRGSDRRDGYWTTIVLTLGLLTLSGGQVAHGRMAVTCATGEAFYEAFRPYEQSMTEKEKAEYALRDSEKFGSKLFVLSPNFRMYVIPPSDIASETGKRYAAWIWAEPLRGAIYIEYTVVGISFDDVIRSCWLSNDDCSSVVLEFSSDHGQLSIALPAKSRGGIDQMLVSTRKTHDCLTNLPLATELPEHLITSLRALLGQPVTP
jgi:hypothetical protein